MFRSFTLRNIPVFLRRVFLSALMAAPGGCLVSDVPLITENGAAFPFESGTVLQTYKLSDGKPVPSVDKSGNAKTGKLIVDDGFYRFESNEKKDAPAFRLSRIGNSNSYVTLHRNSTPKLIAGTFYYGLVKVDGDVLYHYAFQKTDFDKYAQHMKETAPGRWAIYSAGSPWRVSDKKTSVYIRSLAFLEIVLPQMASGGFHSSKSLYRMVASGPRPSASAAPGHRCDALAAHPADPGKPGGVSGLADRAVDPAAAVEACADAVEANPDEPRFAFQLGRALMLGGKSDLAVGFLKDAASGGNAAAFAYLGDLEEDPENARKLYASAAGRGFAPAAGLAGAGVSGASGERCDRLAAHPDDPARPRNVSAVPDGRLDASAAADACAEAVKADPDNARYRFQLGRALALVEGMDGDAAEQLRLASEAGHAGAAAYLAGLVESDEEAEKLLESAAKGGFAPARRTLADLKNARTQQAAAQAMRLDGSLFRRPNIIGALAKGQRVKINDESMGYLGGFLETYLPTCPWLGNNRQLTSVVQFHQAATQRALTGMFDFSNMVKNTVVYANASKDGQTDSYRFIETYGCEGDLARKFTAGLVGTVQVAGAAGPAKASRFVQSCARTRLNETQCACLAELGRGVDPGINETIYNSRTTIKSLVNRNPFLGFMIGMQCKIGDY